MAFRRASGPSRAPAAGRACILTKIPLATIPASPLAANRARCHALSALLAFSLAVPALPTELAAAGRSADPQRAARVAAGQPSGPPEPLIAVISIADQHIEIFGPSGSMTRSRISTGKSGHDTPTGVFSILQRNRFHRSNIYSNAPMPFMQRLTWSGIALHQGVVPGYRASHGCIRLPGSFAETLWGMGRIGMRVVVSPTRTAPVSFSHQRLPVAAVQPVAMPSQQASGLVRVAAAGDTAAPESGGTRELAPFDAAQARLARAIADKAAADRAVKPAHDLAAARSAEAQEAAAALRAASARLAEAEEDLELERLAMANVQTETAERIVAERIAEAEARVATARAAIDGLAAAERQASDAAFAAASAARDAQRAVEETAEEVSLARKFTSPISLFVSRKTGHVYARQGFHELFEGPVTIAGPDRPLGTHVYTAIEGGAGSAPVRWVSVSVPTNGGEPSPRKAARGAEPAAGVERPSTAAEALDRIELPEEVRTLLAERLWPGASLIVSDFGLGETTKGTDFVIITR